jgi:hypothetical protein
VTRDEIIALIVAKAHEHGIEPWELLGGAIAESNLDPNAYRDGPWPDKSPGLFQQTIKFADEGDHTDSPENIALIKHLYFDPVHATDVAAKKYLYWRHDPDVPPLTAWVAYNSPGFYHTPDESPNLRSRLPGHDPGRRLVVRPLVAGLGAACARAGAGAQLHREPAAQGRHRLARARAARRERQRPGDLDREEAPG